MTKGQSGTLTKTERVAIASRKHKPGKHAKTMQQRKDRRARHANHTAAKRGG